MKHKLQIRVSDEPQRKNCFACKKVTFRERMVRMLFGKRQKFLVLVPGDAVEEVAITKVSEGGRS